MELGTPLPLRLGFYLQRVGISCFNWPTVAYRGIDRMPHIPTPEQEPDLYFTPKAGRSRMADLWARYLDAIEQGRLNTDLKLTCRLRAEFLANGVDLEIVYSEVVTIPQDLEGFPHGKLWLEGLASILPTLEQTHRQIAKRPNNMNFLGYDIAQLFENFHSAIFQPGLHEYCPHLPDHLNPVGLFDDLDTASKFVQTANEMDYGPQPFCILGVWESLPVL